MGTIHMTDTLLFFFSANQKASEMMRFFGEDASSPGHVSVVLAQLTDFVSSFGQSKTRHMAKLQRQKKQSAQRQPGCGGS